MEEILHVDLIQAIMNSDNDGGRSILDQGCSQATLDSGLCWASRYGNVFMLHLLIEKGANPNGEGWGGFTPLIWAAMFSNNIEVLNILIDAGSDLDHTSNKRRQTALHAAVIADKRGFVECLLNAGANPDQQDFLYKTPLLHAVHKNLSQCVSLLIQHNCNVNRAGWVNGISTTPLLLALVQNNLEITKMLLLAGAKFQKIAIYQTYNIRQYYATVENNLNMEVRPIYLQQQCRVCIRHLLKPRFLEKLKEMLLPTKLKEYLEIVELFGYDR
ncbi:hypothetical protein FSP39_016132 [Pinctada imbricata]|uniref:SOCS box domain-containing protein n=1 Tax=Pinctada imbricata TaxID=66713 RepID=A0AA89C4N0_PINIB|nr:hypothetical protein FSP39_016132 [Pinctada imbricata]